MIQAKVVADSITPTGDRLTTLEVVFPRYILAEGKTHRIISGMLEQTTVETSIGLNDEYYLSKNSASSRAIPFNKMVKEAQENPFIPYAWQKDHKGMQGTEYITEENDIWESKALWLRARDKAVFEAKELNRVGITKQLANRLLEPFLYHKVLISATEWENFFNLRCPQYRYNSDYTFKSRKDFNLTSNKIDGIKYDETDILLWLQKNEGQADIHMMFLAEAIYDAMNESTPKEMKEGEWHIPFSNEIDLGKVASLSVNKDLSILELIQRISIARCARLSYQTLGDNPEINYEKDLELYEVLSKSGHWSPFEHIARVMTSEEYHCFTKGFKHYDEDSRTYYYNEDSIGWCRNFKGFIQYRELLDN